MSEQIICDECGDPIDQSQEYISGSAQKLSMVDGVLTASGEHLRFDFHIEHAPGAVYVEHRDEGAA